MKSRAPARFAHRTPPGKRAGRARTAFSCARNQSDIATLSDTGATWSSSANIRQLWGSARQRLLGADDAELVFLRDQRARSASHRLADADIDRSCPETYEALDLRLTFDGGGLGRVPD